ncbi:MAG TPA: YiiX/YebB-like N1pC/P60 family cysteine hydrolase [Burkholderiales bacterium]|nr:YiiX/YebB-like N1pC/P60 family cysteine hydrolase [Burkholderiales bacterium]
MSRPLSRWIARATSLLIDALAYYLARPVERQSPSNADPLSLAAVLVRGDVLLTDGNTRMAALVRRVTRSTWSHVSMYVGPLEDGPDPRCVIEADVKAGVRAVRLSQFKGQRIRILRATGLGEAERGRLAEWVVGRVGHGYDLALAWTLARRFLRLPLPSLFPGAESATRFICSSLLAQAFLLVGYPIAQDYSSVTPSDFEAAPVFEVVKPT